MTKPTKSPFYVVQDFISPLMCEEIIHGLNHTVPDTTTDGKPMSMTRSHEPSQELVYAALEPKLPEIEQHYNFKHRGTEPMVFEWYPEGCEGHGARCENSNYLRRKWLKTKNRDFTGIVFFTDYNEHPPFDPDFEVYGGKLEFPQHGFGFNPERGTLIIYPSGPHFINAITPIQVGDLTLVRFHLVAQSHYIYNPTEFPGDYRTWFETFA